MLPQSTKSRLSVLQRLVSQRCLCSCCVFSSPDAVFQTVTAHLWLGNSRCFTPGAAGSRVPRMEDTWLPPGLWATSLLLCLPIYASATRPPSGSNQDEQTTRKQKDCKVGRDDVVSFSLKADAGHNPTLSYSCWGTVWMPWPIPCDPGQLPEESYRLRLTRNALSLCRGFFWFSLDHGEQGLPWIPGEDEPRCQRNWEPLRTTSPWPRLHILWFLTCPTQTYRRWGGLVAQVGACSQALPWGWCPQDPPSSWVH